MDAKYINKNYLEESIKDYDDTIVEPIRSVVSNIYYNAADSYNDLLNVINASVSGGIGLDLQLNYINSTSPVNYQNAHSIIFTTGQIGNLWCDTPGKAGTQYYDWNAATNTLTFSSLTGIVTANTDMSFMLSNCMFATFIGNILIPNNVTNLAFTFNGCTNFNQNILIPNSVTSLDSTFKACSNLNQNILIPNSATSMANTFESCTNFNQNILIPNSVTKMTGTFDVCRGLNQNILIPNSVTDLDSTFMLCSRLNQNILIPNSVTSLRYTFDSCSGLNQNDIYVYSQNISNMYNAFADVAYIGNIHVPTSVPKDETNDMYNSLVNGYAGYTFAPENIINDLPVDIAQWPPV